MNAFRSGEHASKWLANSLKKLETHVRDAAEVHRLASEGVREVLSDVHTDPALFSRDAAERVRRYTARVSRATMDELRSGGFRLDVMERSNLSLMGRDVDLALEVFQAMAGTLRRRIESLSNEGTRRYEDGQTALSAATNRVSTAVEAVRHRWETEGPGRHANSVLPWRRKRAKGLNPKDDPVYRLDVSTATQAFVPELQTALRDAAEGAVVLSIARYYGDIINHLATFISSAEAVREKSRARLSKTTDRLVKVRADARSVAGEVADSLLLEDDALDRVLDRLGVDATGFLRHGELPWHEMGDVSAKELEESVRTWVEAQVGSLSMPTLAQALGGIHDTDRNELRRCLLEFLDQGQPLMSFNDDLALKFEGGSHAQYFVMAEVSDDSIQAALNEACNQMSLPPPLVDVVKPEVPGTVSMRIMQFAAGIPFFAQAQRLADMVEAHDDVMSRKSVSSTSSQVGPLATALRDVPEAAELPGILPDAVARAIAEPNELERWNGPNGRDGLLGAGSAANADRETSFVDALKAAADPDRKQREHSNGQPRLAAVADAPPTAEDEDVDTVEIPEGDEAEAALLEEMLITGELRPDAVRRARRHGRTSRLLDEVDDIDDATDLAVIDDESEGQVGVG